MLTIGQDILKGLKETRKFYEQVGLLVRTVEDLLGEQGWTNALKNNSRKTCDITSDLYQTHKWKPRLISRFYMNEGLDNILIYVGVLLDLETKWQGFEEPWLTCGLYQFIPGVNPLDKVDLNYVGAHLWDKLEADGKFKPYTWNKQEMESEDFSGYSFQSTMALPLVTMKNADDLKIKVVEPLLTEIKTVISPPKVN